MDDARTPPDDFAAAFEVAAARLRAAVAKACARPGPWPERVGAAIEATLAFAGEDPAAARLLLVDSRARGRMQRLAAKPCWATSPPCSPPAASRLPLRSSCPESRRSSSSALSLRVSANRWTPRRRLPDYAQSIEFVLLHYLDPAEARLWSRLPYIPPEPSGPATALDLRVVEFTEVLARLQGVIGFEAQVVVNLPGHFSTAVSTPP